jgi:4-hydroxybenzoate polyprenyltransferase
MGILALGIICLILGFVLAIPILWTIGIILVVIGVVLVLIHEVPGRPAGRRYYWY